MVVGVEVGEAEVAVAKSDAGSEVERNLLSCVEEVGRDEVSAAKKAVR